MEPIAIAVVAAAALGGGVLLARGRRTVDERLERLRDFFRARPFGEVQVGLASSTYGHPGYEVTFESAAQEMAFTHSPDYNALLVELAAMHEDRKDFRPEVALHLESA